MYSRENAMVSEASATNHAADSSEAGGHLNMRDVYYPGTEQLGPNEMRVVALGTGMPSIRPKQAAACFLVELGNGDKFLFDIGYGSAERLSAMKIPMDYLDKIFIGHLHMDHFGDLDAMWIGGVKMNRTYPLRVWGPSGEAPEMGTAAAIDGMKKMYHWDAFTLKGLLDKQKYRPDFALALSVFKHTSPQQFGNVMSMTEPRLAVGFHFYNDHDTLPLMLEEIRKTYDGPLALATDYMVFNVTKDDIRVRMAAIDEEVWPTEPTRPKETSPSVGDAFTEFTVSGKEPMPELVEQIYREFNEANGTDVPLPK